MERSWPSPAGSGCLPVTPDQEGESTWKEQRKPHTDQEHKPESELHLGSRSMIVAAETGPNDRVTIRSWYRMPHQCGDRVRPPQTTARRDCSRPGRARGGYAPHARTDANEGADRT